MMYVVCLVVTFDTVFVFVLIVACWFVLGALRGLVGFALIIVYWCRLKCFTLGI